MFYQGIKMLSKYKQIFGKIIPFIFPVVMAAAIFGQFRMAKQKDHIDEVENKLEALAASTDMAFKGSVLAQADDIPGQKVCDWLKEAVAQKVIDSNNAGLWEEEDYFIGSFNKVSLEEKKDFVMGVAGKISNPKDQKIIMLRCASSAAPSPSKVKIL